MSSGKVQHQSSSHNYSNYYDNYNQNYFQKLNKDILNGVGTEASTYLGAARNIQMFGTEMTEADKRKIENGYNQVSIHTQLT